MELGRTCRAWASLEHGTDDEPAQGGLQGHGDSVPVVVKKGHVRGLDERYERRVWHRANVGKASREALGPGPGVGASAGSGVPPECAQASGKVGR